MTWYRVSPQVRSVLSRILLCRTAVLRDRVYECPQCRSRCHVYNSCTDRHCPQCSGARRAGWLDKTRELLQEGVNYFQLVYTLPDSFSPLILGNRRELYDLLFRSAWLTKVTQSDWNVFIEGPPDGESDPADVLKYLARYLTGGPISDRRIIRDEHDRVSFWARSKNKAAGNPSRPFELSGKEFVRRWSMHILPKGYTRTRCYGGYHGTKRQPYGNHCRELLASPSSPPAPSPERSERTPPTCPRCMIPMSCVEEHRRPSWKEVFDRRIYQEPAIYSPMLHSLGNGPAAIPYEPDG